MSCKVTGHNAIVFPDSIYCKHGNIYFIMSEAIVFRKVRMLKLPLKFQIVIYKYKTRMLNVFAINIRYMFNIVIIGLSHYIYIYSMMYSCFPTPYPKTLMQSVDKPV